MHYKKREGKLGVFTVKISQNKMLHTDYSAASAYNPTWGWTVLKLHSKYYDFFFGRIHAQYTLKLQVLTRVCNQEINFSPHCKYIQGNFYSF